MSYTVWTPDAGHAPSENISVYRVKELSIVTSHAVISRLSSDDYRALGLSESVDFGHAWMTSILGVNRLHIPRAGVRHFPDIFYKQLLLRSDDLVAICTDGEGQIGTVVQEPHHVGQYIFTYDNGKSVIFLPSNAPAPVGYTNVTQNPDFELEASLSFARAKRKPFGPSEH